MEQATPDSATPSLWGTTTAPSNLAGRFRALHHLLGPEREHPGATTLSLSPDRWGLTQRIPSTVQLIVRLAEIGGLNRLCGHRRHELTAQERKAGDGGGLHRRADPRPRRHRAAAEGLLVQAVLDRYDSCSSPRRSLIVSRRC